MVVINGTKLQKINRLIGQSEETKVSSLIYSRLTIYLNITLVYGLVFYSCIVLKLNLKKVCKSLCLSAV